MHFSFLKGIARAILRLMCSNDSSCIFERSSHLKP